MLISESESLRTRTLGRLSGTWKSGPDRVTGWWLGVGDECGGADERDVIDAGTECLGAPEIDREGRSGIVVSPALGRREGIVSFGW